MICNDHCSNQPKINDLKSHSSSPKTIFFGTSDTFNSFKKSIHLKQVFFITKFVGLCFRVLLDLNGLRLPWSKHRKSTFLIETLVGFVLEEPHYHSVLWGILAILLSEKSIEDVISFLKNLAIAYTQNISAHRLRLLIIIMKMVTSVEFTVKPYTLETRIYFRFFWFPILFCQLTTLFVLSIPQPVSSTLNFCMLLHHYISFPSEWEHLWGI